MPDVLPGKIKGARGRDARKFEKEWKDVERIYEFADGWYIGYVKDPADQATLGRLQGHCSGTHFVWTVEEKIWYFFVLFDQDDFPRSTIHAKQASWMKKSHPRDKCPPMPSSIGDRHRWGYPSLEDIKKSFKDEGLKYEPGKYCALTYDSRAYDSGLDYDYDDDCFEYQYGRPVVNGGKCPQNVDPEIWNAYVKAGKAVEDNYRKNTGNVKVVGRRFKFDGKWLIILSASNKSQQNVHGNAGKLIAEWLNSANRKEKK